MFVAAISAGEAHMCCAQDRVEGLLQQYGQMLTAELKRFGDAAGERTILALSLACRASRRAWSGCAWEFEARAVVRSRRMRPSAGEATPKRTGCCLTALFVKTVFSLCVCVCHHLMFHIVVALPVRIRRSFGLLQTEMHVSEKSMSDLGAPWRSSPAEFAW